MKSIKKLSLVTLSLSILATLSLNGDETVCHRCEEIREYNAEHHQNFEYYDDYLKTQHGEASANENTINKKG